MSNVLRHKEICDELNALYVKKNHDYADSFHLSYLEEGMAMPRIRLGDKLNRFKQLSKNPDSQSVNDESIRDTLIDLANYAIMTVLELESSSNVVSNDETRFTFHGHVCRVVRKGNEFDARGCLICDVCVHAGKGLKDHPCTECRHHNGDHEHFKLNNRKVEIIE